MYEPLCYTAEADTACKSSKLQLKNKLTQEKPSREATKESRSFEY